MNKWSRRTFVLAAGASVAACSNGLSSKSGNKIDGRVDTALSYMMQEINGTRDLVDKSNGMLVMPNVTKAGLGFGGAYGEGALRIGGASVDYYSTAQASFGLQIGAQQYATTFFFMTPEALADFRAGDGWSVGADVGYVLTDNAGNLGIDSTSVLSPVVAVVYGQAGLIIGATLEGTKYTRIIR